MQVRRLDHLAITVADTARSLAFYVDLLGLEQVEQHELPSSSIDTVFGLSGASGRSTRLCAPGTREILIDIMEMDSPIPGSVAPLGALGGCHFALTVDDLATVVTDLRGKGVVFLSDPVTFHLTDGSVTVCFLRDPDGNYVELMQIDG